MGLANLLLSLLNIYALILFVRALMSWFDPMFSSQVGRFIYQITEPVVEPVRRVIRPIGGVDLSIMVTIFLVIILQRLIMQVM
ncbi:MAG: YggT family protein [Thermomicrobiales bacterium]|nr:YggT family protein [Thermomicrobiales bacterium]MCO5219500.1 YggT family protein [Thermomicrobiales bacterium]MCO5224886.1 YggT family protein [Thermomicrobiales bacterium]MCO5228472.1 YggT family protein [Thermomicrobiales bacterium]